MSRALRVLVADDESRLRELLVRELGRKGHEVEGVGDGEAALARLRERAYDVVILDMKMPRKEGIEVLRELSAFPEHPQVIVMTGFQEVATAVEAMKLGAYDYLTKPTKIEELDVVIRKAAEKGQLLRDNHALRAHAAGAAPLSGILTKSPRMHDVMRVVERVAPTNSAVLVLGESGTGKELVARAIHERSPRQAGALVRVNCASVPRELFESEFFGHVRGAFTGAVKDRVGRFELADGGTLFLDEIGEVPLELQSKLLRVLQEGQFEKLGEDRTRTVQVRLIAATNRDLLAEAKTGRFRLDLYYRLSVFPIEVPSLWERLEDLAELAEHFIKQASRRLGVPRPRLTKIQAQELQGYDWPGNVRELQNVIERAVILAKGGKLQFELPHRANRDGPVDRPTLAPGRNGEAELSLDELAVREREIVTAAVHRTNWKIYGTDGAAALLRIKPTTLVSKMKRLNIQRGSA